MLPTNSRETGWSVGRIPLPITDFPNPADSVGLYNSGEEGGSAFYDRRVTSRQYVGVTYEYNRVLGYPPSGTVESQTQSVLPFYSVFFSKTFSVSAAAGPVRWSVSQPEQPTASSWTGATALNIGWQGDKGNLAASFLRTVTSGGGLIGAFTSVGANFAGAWKFSHAWSGKMGSRVSEIEPVNPLQFWDLPGRQIRNGAGFSGSHARRTCHLGMRLSAFLRAVQGHRGNCGRSKWRSGVRELYLYFQKAFG